MMASEVSDFPGGSDGKCLPIMWETWVHSLGQEDPPGEGNGNPLQYSCLENPTDGRRSLVDYSPQGSKESDTTERLHFRGEQTDQIGHLLLFNYIYSLKSWRRKWQPTPVFLSGKSHGQRSLAGYSPWGRRVRQNLVTNSNSNSLAPLGPSFLVPP